MNRYLILALLLSLAGCGEPHGVVEAKRIRDAYTRPGWVQVIPRHKGGSIIIVHPPQYVPPTPMVSVREDDGDLIETSTTNAAWSVVEIGDRWPTGGGE